MTGLVSAFRSMDEDSSGPQTTEASGNAERSVRSIRTFRSEEKTEHFVNSRFRIAAVLTESSAWVGVPPAIA